MPLGHDTNVYELRLDGQVVGHFSSLDGIGGDDDGTHLPGLRRSITVSLEDGVLHAEYEEWVAYGRSQVGKHGEIVGPVTDGTRHTWAFEEAWPVGADRTRSAGPNLSFRRLQLEIEHVVERDAAEPVHAAPTPAEVPPSQPQGEPDEPLGFWARLFRRRR